MDEATHPRHVLWPEVKALPRVKPIFAIDGFDGPSEWSASRVLDLIARMLDLTDDQLAERTSWSRATVNAKRFGKSSLTVGDLVRLGEALDVAPEIFMKSPGDAAREILTTKAQQFQYNDVHGAGG